MAGAVPAATLLVYSATEEQRRNRLAAQENALRLARFAAAHQGTRIEATRQLYHSVSRFPHVRQFEFKALVPEPSRVLVRLPLLPPADRLLVEPARLLDILLVGDDVDGPVDREEVRRLLVAPGRERAPRPLDNHAAVELPEILDGILGDPLPDRLEQHVRVRHRPVVRDIGRRSRAASHPHRSDGRGCIATPLFGRDGSRAGVRTARSGSRTARRRSARRVTRPPRPRPAGATRAGRLQEREAHEVQGMRRRGDDGRHLPDRKQVASDGPAVRRAGSPCGGRD